VLICCYALENFLSGAVGSAFASDSDYGKKDK